VLSAEITHFSVFSPEIKNKTRALHLPLLARLNKKHAHYSDKFRGCNVSFWRKDFIAINGYNETFEGWGKEDSDLVIRMGNNRVMAKRLKFSGIVYHIYHKINSRHNLEANNNRQDETIANKVVWCANGVDKYLN
jgi:predicted glycosyltransferase involved in capsule biosynthesis